MIPSINSSKPPSIPPDFSPPLTFESITNNLLALSLQETPSPINATSSAIKQMLVSKIRFTQSSVSPNFTDGTLVADLTQKLAIGHVSPEDIPPIRIVKHRNQFWTLDNRRFRAFKDSFTNKIPIEIVDLEDPSISREFWDKKTNKSLTEGGAVRRESPKVLTKEQFEAGIYVFNNKILNWTFGFIDQPMSSHLKTPLCDTYNERSTYYNGFENLIFEEARAILQTGLQEAENQNKYPFQFSLINLKTANNEENATEMKFFVLPGSQKDIKSGDALLLESVNHPNLRTIALANYSPLDPLRPELSFKVVIEWDDRFIYNQALEPEQRWKGIKLGSLITLRRMFDTCSSAPGKTPFVLEKYFLSGKPSLPYSKRECSEIEEELLTSLNPSQREAVNKFLQLEEGLDLIQGPPGTGKTTTVIQLLGVLQTRQERVLVSAPSNKAVQILAERFMKQFPDVPILLVGVEEKLPPGSPLSSVFMDSWATIRISQLNALKGELWKFQPQKLLEGDLKFIHRRIKRKCQDLLKFKNAFNSFVSDVTKYQFSSLKDIESITQEFAQSITDYSQEIISHTASDWEDVKKYYDQINENKQTPVMPDLIGKMCSSLSTIATIISSLQMKLGRITEEELLNHSHLVFATLSISGQQRFKDINTFDTLIIDEAGQAVEAETLIPIKMNPKKCLLIGDIKQLPATVISQEAEKLKFGRSMMERLIDDCDQPFSMLNIQYRMRPEISHWPSQKYYQNELINDPSVCQTQYALKGIGNDMPFLAPYSFIDIDGKEARGPSGRSFFNAAEVESTALIIHHLAQKCLIDVESRVSIISFYALQVAQIKDVLSIKYPKIKVNTVDGFQGGESDVVIISCVRANYEKQIGFLKASKRLNVALTRAKFSLIILGNQPTLAKSDIAELVIDAKKRNVLFDQKVIEPLRQNYQLQSKGPSKKIKPRKVCIKQPDQKTQACFEFARSSTCRRGNRCHFQHNVVIPPQNSKNPKRFNSRRRGKK